MLTTNDKEDIHISYLSAVCASASVSFDVIEEDLVIEDFTLKCDEEVFYDNDSYKINYEVTSKPTATATPKTQFTWTSSNEEVVKVGSKGELTTIKVGTATITAVEEISGIEKAESRFKSK